ncbi:MAG: roadblock/LC7 domain-containing protein [Streptosporangiaceae bacterium]
MTAPTAGSPRSASPELGWLLDDLMNRVGEVRKALVLSRDGLVMGASRGIGREEADYLAALASGLNSLASASRQHFGANEVRQTIVEMDTGLFFVAAAGNGSCLAVLSDAGANAGLVAYEMSMLVKRVRRQLSTAPRQPTEGLS